MDISNNLYCEKSITSTVDLDNQNIVADRKIDLEFKEVLTNSSNNVKSYQKVIPRYKEVEIYDNYRNPKFQSVGKGSYTVVEKRIEISKQFSSKRIPYTQNKIERNYQTKNLTSPGTIINKLF